MLVAAAIHTNAQYIVTDTLKDTRGELDLKLGSADRYLASTFILTIRWAQPS